MSSIQWNLAASTDTDQSVRSHLAGQGAKSEDDLSKFIEEAVGAHILELSAEAAKTANIDVNETDLSAVVGEPLQWTRGR